MSNIRIGWGEKNVCPKGGKIYIAGGVPFRAVEKVHDEIKATAMVVQSGAERIIWVSCDICHPTKQIEDKVIELLTKQLPDFKAEELIISGTHATACFYVSDTEILDCGHLLESCEEILAIDIAREQLCRHVAEAVLEAVSNMEEEEMTYTSMDILTGFCRRVVYKDGHAQMYGDVHKDDFWRMEYPDGGETKVLYFYEKGTQNLKAVLAAAPCPAQADESSAHITADFWGYTRNIIKEQYGENVKLFALCRAAGELSPHRLFAEKKDGEWGTEAAERLGKWVGEQLIMHERKAKATTLSPGNQFQYLTEEITFPARKITEEQYVWAKKYRCTKENFDINGKAIDWETDSLARHIIKFKENNIDTYDAKFGVVRVGNSVFFTAPVELYTEYAKRIIARFPNFTIFDIQLTHDSIGYLPTKEAIAGGGYSTAHFSALCDEYGGEVYVKKICSAIDWVINK